MANGRGSENVRSRELGFVKVLLSPRIRIRTRTLDSATDQPTTTTTTMMPNKNTTPVAKTPKPKTVRFALAAAHPRIRHTDPLPRAYPTVVGQETAAAEEEAEAGGRGVPTHRALLLAHALAFSVLLLAAAYLLHARLAGPRCVAVLYLGLVWGFSGRGVWDG